jgi:hypothetical protein
MSGVVLQLLDVTARRRVLDVAATARETGSRWSVAQLRWGLALTWVAETSVYVGGCGALKGLRRLMVHLFVVHVGVGCEGFGWRGGAGGEGLAVELGGSVVADELSGLVLGMLVECWNALNMGLLMCSGREQLSCNRSNVLNVSNKSNCEKESTYTTAHERLAGLDVSGELALVGNGVGVYAHYGSVWWLFEMCIVYEAWGV